MKKRKEIESVLQKEKRCYFCRRTDHLEKHHVFYGRNHNRELSGSYGYTVWLCHWCHNEPPKGVHFNQERRQILYELGQKHFEENHGSRQDFINIFGRSYL